MKEQAYIYLVRLEELVTTKLDAMAVDVRQENKRLRQQMDKLHREMAVIRRGAMHIVPNDEG